MAEHIQVPLKNLRFGHEAPNHPGNARTTGREDDIATLAAHIFARGKIDDLLIYDDGVPDIYFVSNGNRSLAALRMIHTADSDELIDCKLTTAERAYEDSLAVAVLAKKFHPVDEYEGFAKLRDDLGKSEEEIAREYGKTEKEVKQVLALGRLSPKIRDAWRKGEIKADVAKAFTLADDQKLQDKVYADLLKRGGTIFESMVKAELGANATSEEVAQLLEFIGVDAYRAAGGGCTEDLFGHSHIVTNETLLKQMARRALDAECERLKADGWAWADILGDLPHAAPHWPKSEPKKKLFEGEEQARLETLKAEIDGIAEGEDHSDEEIERQEKLLCEEADIVSAMRSRSFEPKQKAKLGCIVDIHDGHLVVLYGVKKPEEVKRPDDAEDDAREPSKPAKGASAKPAEPPPEEDISNALIQRLQQQSANAAGTALIQDEQLALSLLLAGFDCYSGAGIRVSAKLPGGQGKLLGANGDMGASLALARKLKPAERIALLAQVVAGALDFSGSIADGGERLDGISAIVNAIDAKDFNAAARGAFDAKDYFNGVSKKLNLKAIEEAMGADHARQQSDKSKAEIVDFAIENVPAIGWLPVQLRAKGYDGPPVKAASIAKPSTREAMKAAKAQRETKRNGNIQKRAAKSKAKKQRRR